MIRSIISFLLVLFVVTAANALPIHPYAPWKIDCLDNRNQTTIHPDGSMRDALPSEVWSSELQNDAELKTSSVRCWCRSDVQHEWDTEELGPGSGWWSFIKHLTENGQTCACPDGQAILMEFDHNSCIGDEDAYGFFYCSGSTCDGIDYPTTAVASSSASRSDPCWLVNYY